MSYHLYYQTRLTHTLLVTNALLLCKAMLSHSDTLYPFAATATADCIDCLFTTEDKQLADTHMIEDLTDRVEQAKTENSHLVGLIAHAVMIQTDDDEECDALMIRLCDSDNTNTVTLYPYTHESSGIVIGHPISCDFIDK